MSRKQSKTKPCAWSLPTWADVYGALLAFTWDGRQENCNHRDIFDRNGDRVDMDIVYKRAEMHGHGVRVTIEWEAP